MNYQSTRRKRRTSMERARLLAEYEQSELTQREFAERNGISMSCLSQWLRKSRAVGNGQAKHRAFLELPVPLAPRESVRPMFRIEFPGGQSVELHTGFELEELRQICQLLCNL